MMIFFRVNNLEDVKDDGMSLEFEDPFGNRLGITDYIN